MTRLIKVIRRVIYYVGKLFAGVYVALAIILIGSIPAHFTPWYDLPATTEFQDVLILGGLSILGAFAHNWVANTVGDKGDDNE